ncbi:unnamed protein product, partial [Polarella glacialis]
DRLGLLLAVLGDGELRLYSLSVDLPEAPLFARFAPAWTAPVSMPGAMPTEAWDRRVCCAAARADPHSPGSCLLAGGCDRSVVLLWHLKGEGDLEDIEDLPLGPTSMLQANLLESQTVLSLAWCPDPEPHLLLAGLSGGFLVLWDVRAPSAPLCSYYPQMRSPIPCIVWLNPFT